MLPYFTQYVALGDSISIDLYPALDAGEIDVAVALERDPTAGLRALGAARQSLRTRLLTIPFSLLLPLGGAAVGGEVGFAAGLAASMWIGGVLWWAAFGKAHGAVGVDAEVSPPADETGLRTGAPPDPT